MSDRDAIFFLQVGETMPNRPEEIFGAVFYFGVGFICRNRLYFEAHFLYSTLFYRTLQFVGNVGTKKNKIGFLL